MSGSGECVGGREEGRTEWRTMTIKAKIMETDSVTGALNRTGFFHKVRKMLESNPEQDYAIAYFNIQRFKTVNDLFGYEAGDALLKKVAEILANCFLKPLAVGRMEADRFTVFTRKCDMDLERLPELLHRTYNKGELKLDLYGKCGIYYIPRHCSLSVSDMCDRAKLAKSSITNQFVQPYAVFNEQMREDYEQRSIALLHLDDAIQNGEIKVFYQPIYDAWTGKVVLAEALTRWFSCEFGNISPAKFIPILEESGYITKLDSYVYQSVYGFLEKRQREGRRNVDIGVNLSRMDLMDKHIMEKILNDVRTSELPRGSISYELTESAYAGVSEDGNRFLAQMHAAGAKLLVDDFGSGVSSFSTIRDYDFDILKLDMGFVQKIGLNRKNNNIIISLIELAHRLDLKVIAEGVETKEQADFLKNYGCDYFQGYYFAKPMPQEEFEALLDK